LFPPGSLTLSGTGANRTLTLQTTPPRSGETTIVLTVRDELQGPTTVNIPVTVINNLPTISPLSNSVELFSGTSIQLPFTVNDIETPATALQVSVAAGDSKLFPAGSLSISGPGKDRTLKLDSTAPTTGVTSVTITVQDAFGGQSTLPITVTVKPPLALQVGSTDFTVGADAGGRAVVKSYKSDGTLRTTTAVLGGVTQGDFLGGVRIASAELNSDSRAEFAVGTGPGVSTRVEVYDGQTSGRLKTLEPFEPTFLGGVFVSMGDLNRDGIAEIVVTPDEGGGPRVRVYNGKDFSIIADFFGIEDLAFRGGARSAISDINGDGTGDLIVAAGFGGGPRVAVFDGNSLLRTPQKLFGDFFAFETALRNGVYLAAGDVNFDGFADLIAGGGPGGGPRVQVFDGKQLLNNQQLSLANFFAGDVNDRNGIRPSVKNLDGDPKADLVVASGSSSRIRAYLGKSLASGSAPPVAFEFSAFADFFGGTFVG
jgi:large repetitive protein